MSTPTLTETPAGLRPRRRLLRGLPWLVVRQHRTALACVLGLAVLGTLWIVYQRHEMVQLLEAGGWPEKDVRYAVDDSRSYGYVSSLLSGLPLILAVFIGAPLIAGDRENGTAQLVTTQSVTRRQWLIAKLGLAYTLALVIGLMLSAAFTWWWEPHRSFFLSEWVEGPIFDNTGPVLPALLLFVTAAGITIGVLVRRVLPAMVVTFLFTAVTQFVWDEVRVRLGSTQMFTYPKGTELPARFDEAYEVDRWVGNAQGELFGWGTCAEATEKAQNACVEEHGIINDVIEYLDYDQMAAMQWTAAGILLAGTALLTGFVLWRVSRRPL
ncbi:MULTISPECIES: ABC transporter permease [unclassified Streptomyces]|uniref:ABC transporter permease n=1 Tax=unclassified Streptomyces TaxID=2593676 RepID=UPI001BE8C7DF|nr:MULTISPECIES: ABC transporter permease [unclassified Streptomyces]MBT2379242.1 ABC transporter permease subunit [Streptomyces sp. ISL-111]MBT2424218.1 ABC transporter permease subunit [Streptomyces sp. ISL-112]MBT2461037.1 ABC transporter permease subunit [Streptomyces sp. ISL-63]